MSLLLATFLRSETKKVLILISLKSVASSSVLFTYSGLGRIEPGLTGIFHINIFSKTHDEQDVSS